jgi:MFS transporter, ACS family, hexuronate transporter
MSQSLLHRSTNPADQKPVGRFRWVIVALLFSATLINYMDRQILGLLKSDLSKNFNWSEQDFADIVVAFQAAYAIGQFMFGPLIQWFGTKIAYAFSIIWWSLAAMAHALVHSVIGFAGVRFALGLGEAGNFPAAIQAVAEWFPPRERAVATGIFNTGSSIGPVVAPLLVPWLALTFGWRTSFVVLGACGFFWLLFWLIFYDRPGKSRFLGEAELSHIHSGVSESVGRKIPWYTLLGYRQGLAYCLANVLVGPVWWFYLFWLPDFFTKQFGLDLRSFGPPLVAVYSFTAFGSVAGGGLSSYLLRRGWSVNAARKTTAFLCACCTVPVIFAPHTQSVWIAAGLLALAAAAHQAWSATMYTVVSDIFPKNGVASVIGMGGAFAGAAAMGFSWLVGHILNNKQDLHQYSKILFMCGSAYVVAFFIFHLMVPKIEAVQID